MADVKKKVPENIEGEFFVDSTCIDCDTCRQLAPRTFADAGEHSFVHHQPASDEERRLATRALLSCPTASIGTTGTNLAREVMADFPLHLDDEVYYCGFNSPKSFGGNSYFIRHPEGNWLIDSPKFIPQLINKFTEWGGLKYIFLTHRDDVADADKYAAQFGASRIIHEHEADAQPGAERVLTGTEPVELAPGFLAIPTPGHTKGHCVLLYRDRYLFTGDHLAWDREKEHLYAFRGACWYSWDELKVSMAKLLDYRFEWVLTGHEQRVHLPADEMRRELQALVTRM